MREARRKKNRKNPVFFRPPGHTRRPETRPPEPGKTRPETPPEDSTRNRPGTPAGVGTPQPGHTARPENPPPAVGRSRPPGHTQPGCLTHRRPPGLCPGRGWSDPLVCLAATAPKKQRKVRHIPGGGLSNRKIAEKCKKSFGGYLAKAALKNPKGRRKF
jgi:hypothetical protein